MEAIAISSTPRLGRGKGAARQLRFSGEIPAIAYGHGISETQALAIDPRELQRALDNPKGLNSLLSITIDGTMHHVMVKDLQRDPVSRALLHVDLIAPDLNREVVVAVPVSVTGKSIGVTTGGRMVTPYREVRLRAKPADIPASVEVDVTELDHDQAVMASELPLPEGVVPVFERDYVVVKVIAPRGRKETAEVETDAKKKKKK